MIQPSSSSATKRPRDIRLDLFRGLAMLIIVVAHIPSNPWNSWIPARFGFSSAAEMFVFCSGIASALAFGAVFAKRGLILGAMRITYRIWQLYWAQIAPFLVIVVISTWATARAGAPDYLERLDLGWFLSHPAEGIAALMTLRYIPQYFDMLPMYMVVLACLPLAVTLSRLHIWLPVIASGALWLVIQFTGFNLSARPGSDWVWYFNPLAWQFLFILGFSFGMGWLKAPSLRDRRLVALSLAIVLGSIPFAFWGLTSALPALGAVPAMLGYDGGPTNLHPLRLVHFLALAYLALCLIEPWRDTLPTIAALRPVERVGQQTLAAFLASLPIAWTLGILLDWAGRSTLTVTLANLAGLAGILLVAHVVDAFKRQPWREPTCTKRAAPPGAAHVQPAE
ncbi:MAG: OpgC family protein [Bosea sp. (in: a-proteobacteria)]